VTVLVRAGSSSPDPMPTLWITVVLGSRAHGIHAIFLCLTTLSPEMTPCTDVLAGKLLPTLGSTVILGFGLCGTHDLYFSVSRSHVGSCYVVLVWTAQKTPLPIVLLLFHTYPWPWECIYRAIA
jgi:hypothetical protein